MIVESVFGINGVVLVFLAVTLHDFPLIQGIVLLSAVVAVTSLLTDIITVAHQPPTAQRRSRMTTLQLPARFWSRLKPSSHGRVTKRLLANRPAVFATIFVLFLIFVAVFAPLLAVTSPRRRACARETRVRRGRTGSAPTRTVATCSVV